MFEDSDRLQNITQMFLTWNIAFTSPRVKNELGNAGPAP